MKKKILFLILFSAFIMQGAIAQENKKLQKIVVKGYVKDINGQPIRGAVIAAPNTEYTRKTNKKGFYKMKIMPTAQNLLAIVPGDTYLEIPFEKNANHDFVIEFQDGGLSAEQENQINKMFIDKGYNEDVIYRNSSDAVIYNSRRINPHKYSSFSQMVGQEMRSVHSLVSPFGLYILDGESFFGVRHLNHLKPTEVKSIEILDAHTAAFGYGMRGMYGVCIVKTKAAASEDESD